MHLEPKLGNALNILCNIARYVLFRTVMFPFIDGAILTALRVARLKLPNVNLKNPTEVVVHKRSTILAHILNKTSNLLIVFLCRFMARHCPNSCQAAAGNASPAEQGNNSTISDENRVVVGAAKVECVDQAADCASIKRQYNCFADDRFVPALSYIYP